jgi:hypothetical protein
VGRFWSYRTARFARERAIFDRQERKGLRPPVFNKQHALRNVIIDPGLPESGATQVRSMIPQSERHRWFRSMRSSQALVQSVFGNLCALKLCNTLHSVSTEQGANPFEGISEDGTSVRLEQRIGTFNEPRRTSIDIYIAQVPKVAIECKLVENDVGHCSRPKLSEDEPKYRDGSYRCQRGRKTRCALSALEIRYWDYVLRLFNWRSEQDYAKCALRMTYQLVRNVLAASIGENGEVIEGYAVLLFDDRNPAFQPDGSGYLAFSAVRDALWEPCRLQRLSWQTVMCELRKHPRLGWLTSELMEKYGL